MTTGSDRRHRDGEVVEVYIVTSGDIESCRVRAVLSDYELAMTVAKSLAQREWVRARGQNCFFQACERRSAKRRALDPEYKSQPIRLVRIEPYCDAYLGGMIEGFREDNGYGNWWYVQKWKVK